MAKPGLFILIIFLFGGIQLVGQSANQGQEQSPSQVPGRVQVNFNAHHQGDPQDVEWQKNEQGYVATFSQSNQQVVSEFDKNGRWIKSQTEVKEKDLPSTARSYIKENYESYDYEGGQLFENKNDTHYEVHIRSENQNRQLTFDKDGGIIEEKDRK